MIQTIFVEQEGKGHSLFYCGGGSTIMKQKCVPRELDQILKQLPQEDPGPLTTFKAGTYIFNKGSKLWGKKPKKRPNK